MLKVPKRRKKKQEAHTNKDKTEKRPTGQHSCSEHQMNVVFRSVQGKY